VFLRHWYNDDRKINTSNRWVWTVHFINYPYMAFIFFFTNARELDPSESRAMWIPLDFLLTTLLTCYMGFFSAMEAKEDEDDYSSVARMTKKTDEETPRSNKSKNSSLMNNNAVN